MTFIYEIEVWYRESDEKDFFITTVKAKTDEEAIAKAKRLRRNIFKTEIKNKIQSN